MFVPNHRRTKFDKNVIRCIFIGHDDEQKGWRCCDLTTGHIYILRNVVFDKAPAWWPSKDMVQSDLEQSVASVEMQ